MSKRRSSGGQDQSDLEAKMGLHIRAAGLPAATHEHHFHPTRDWRFDFAWPRKMVALEVEGGTWLKTKSGYSKGHGHPVRFRQDCEKYNEAALLGWRVLRVVDEHIDSGQAVLWLAEALGYKLEELYQ